MSKLIRTSALALSLALGLAVATACEPATTGQATNTVDVKCAGSTKAIPTDWYFPVGTPKALVWLQHGFTESKDDWVETGRKAADAGFVVMATTLPSADLFGCTVQNIGNNTDFLNNVATMFSGMGTANTAITKSYADAASKAGRSGLAMPAKLEFSGHSAGGEAVLYVANRLRTASPTTFAKLKGLVLQDSVKSFIGDNTDASLTGLATTTLPIYALASPKGSCNADQSGTQAVVSKLAGRAFHGTVITTGVHGDIFGTSANGLGTATCGTPQPTNTAAVRTLTFGWVTDQAAGTTTAAFYPGGSTYDGLVAAGTISTLP